MGRGRSKAGGATTLSQREIDAIDYWRGGLNGRAYANIRSIANGREVDDDEAKRLVSAFESAVKKAPSAENKTLVRVAGDWRIPGHGEPAIGQEFSLEKYTSFSSAPASDYDDLVDKLGNGMKEQIVYRIKGTKQFKDISHLGHETGGTAIEKEALTTTNSRYKIVKVTTVRTEGTWLNPNGNQKYVMVDIEEI